MYFDCRSLLEFALFLDIRSCEESSDDNDDDNDEDFTPPNNEIGEFYCYVYGF